MELSPLEAARKLAPQIRSCADEIEAQRELPRPLFEALADAGIFHMAVPRSIGGGEVDLPTYVQVIEELGKADASTGWVREPGRDLRDLRRAHAARDGARTIWIDTPRAVVANTPAATAKAIVVPGGYRVTGRQGFSTGCRHASWVAAHAQIIENGQVRLEGNGSRRRATCSCRSPRPSCSTPGTCAACAAPAPITSRSTTSSCRRSARCSRRRRRCSRTGPLYRIPRTLLFASGDAAVAFGMARTCLNTFIELAGAKTPRAMPSLLRDQSMVQVTVGQAEACAPHRPRLPHGGGPRDLDRGVRERRDHARSAREPAPRHHARHPAGRADRRRRLQRGRRHRRLRGQPPPAPLPGHPRDHPAPAGPARRTTSWWGSYWLGLPIDENRL